MSFQPEDAFGAYNILQRPPAMSNFEEAGKMKYSDESDETSLSESDSDSDSDSARNKTKRPKFKVKPTRPARENCRTKNDDKFKIWNMQVQEESITEDLVSCGVTRSIYADRSVESYDFTLGYSFKKRGELRQRANNSSDEEREVEERLTNKRNFSDRRNVKLRLGKRRADNEEAADDDHKGSSRVMSDLSITPESSDAEVAADIAAKLFEKKDVLISKLNIIKSGLRFHGDLASPLIFKK